MGHNPTVLSSSRSYLPPLPFLALCPALLPLNATMRCGECCGLPVGPCRAWPLHPEQWELYWSCFMHYRSQCWRQCYSRRRSKSTCAAGLAATSTLQRVGSGPQRDMAPGLSRRRLLRWHVLPSSHCWLRRQRNWGVWHSEPLAA